MSLKYFPHSVVEVEGGSQAQGPQESGEEELLQPSQAGEEEELDWETTGGTGGGWNSARGLQ